jgi:AraC-like DNA-binding protein
MKDSYPKAYLYRRIVQAKLFIDKNFGKNIDLNNIADSAYFSKYHFIRLYKKVYGKTPHRYLTLVRIEKAMQLLRADMQVTDACFLVGFESLSSFSGLFKRVVGVSPSDYLIKQRKIKAQILKTPLDFVPGCFAQKNGWLNGKFSRRKTISIKQ